MVSELVRYEANNTQRTQGCCPDNQPIQLPHVAFAWSSGAYSSTAHGVQLKVVTGRGHRGRKCLRAQAF